MCEELQPLYEIEREHGELIQIAEHFRKHDISGETIIGDMKVILSPSIVSLILTKQAEALNWVLKQGEITHE